jgi:hypothetical protein
MRYRLLLLCATATSVFVATEARAHCEIPCGIYGDDLRFSMLDEDVTTIEKAMNMIVKLSSDTAANANQITRWVLNKERHADHIREIVTQYFMTQRIKLPDMSDDNAVEAYKGHLAVLHKLLVYAMKSKQSTDLDNTKVLHDTVHDFQASYTKK